MAIVTPAEPASAQQALRGALQFLLNRPTDPLAASLTAGGSALEQLQATQPHQTYAIGFDDIVQGKFLDAAQPVAWRYLLVSSGPLLVASADLPSEAGGGAPMGGNPGAGSMNAVAEAFLTTDADGNATCTGVGMSPTVQSTVDALVELEQNTGVQASDYELRYLEIAPLSFYALWLHGASDDIVRPIAPTPTSVSDPVAMSPAQVQPSLQAVAQTLVDKLAQAPDDSGG